MTNPFSITDSFYGNNETFQRRITGKEFGKAAKGFFKKTWSKANYLYIFLVVLVIYILSTIRYFNWSLFTNIFSSSIFIGIVAVGMGLIILLGEIDLSVGSMYALSITISIIAYNNVIVSLGNTALGFFVCLLVSIGSGLLFGFINGFFVGIVKMPSFIVTLATTLIFRSFAQYIGDVTRTTAETSGWVNGSILNMLNYGPGLNNWVRELGAVQFASITLPTILFILVAILIWLMTKYTKFGRKIYAVGSNPKAATLVGIKSNWIKTIVFSLAGALVGFAGFLHIASRGNLDTSSTGNSYELSAIAAVVLGGIAMTGGKGSIIGVIFGIAAFQTIDKIISALNLNPFLNDAIKGAILIIAILIQVLHFDKDKAIYFLQKFNLIYVPNKDLLLDAEYKNKVEKVEKDFENKINKVNHSTKLSEEEIVSKINELLDQKESILKKLNNKYTVLIEKAKVYREIHDKDEKLNEEINDKKAKLLNLKQYNTHLLKNKKEEVAPRLNLYYSYEKDLLLDQMKQEYETNKAILELENKLGASLKQLEYIRDFALDYAKDDEALKEKVSKLFDKDSTKFNKEKEDIKVRSAKLEETYKSDLENYQTKMDELISKQQQIDKEKEDQYVIQIQKQQEKEDLRKTKLAEHEKLKAEKADIKKQEEEKAQKEKDNVDSKLKERLNNIIKNRK